MPQIHKGGFNGHHSCTSTFPRAVFFVLSSSLILISSACFITNCPPGGKRSGRFELEARKCTPCGPPDLGGQCYGSQICCSKAFGCLVGTPETLECALENTFPTPCENTGKSCGGFDMAQPINGHCAAEGICCSSEVCTMDPVCNWGDIVPNSVQGIPGAVAVGVAAGAEGDDEDCDDPVVTRRGKTNPNSNPNARWMPGQVLFPHISYGNSASAPLRHYELSNAKRFFDDDQSPMSVEKKSSAGAETNTGNGRAATKFPVLLKSSRPGLNSIMRRLFSLQKRDGDPPAWRKPFVPFPSKSNSNLASAKNRK